MSNIEEDVNELKSIMNLITESGFAYSQKNTLKLQKSIRNVLAEIEKKDKQIEKALNIAFDYGQTDGEHHKAWVIDQMVRALTGRKYEKQINNYIYDEETGENYIWNKGIAP